MPTNVRPANEWRQRVISRFAAGCDWVDRIAVGMAALCLVIMTLSVVVEVLMRMTLSRSTLFADEIASYMLAGMSFLALGNTLRAGSHLTVGLITERLGRRTRRWLEITTSLVALFCVCFFTSWLLRFAVENYNTGERSQSEIEVPLWLPQSALVIGAAVLILAIIARLTRTLFSESPP